MEIQERYIIGHELGHWLFKLSDDVNLAGNISVPISEMMDEIQLMLAEIYAAYKEVLMIDDISEWGELKKKYEVIM